MRPADAAVVVEAQLEADGRGVDMHTMQGLHWYVDRRLAGDENPTPTVRLADNHTHLTGTRRDMGLPPNWGARGSTITGYTLAFSALAATFIQLICGGVVEHHPKLRFVGAEFEIGWVGHFLQRVDHATYRAPPSLAGSKDGAERVLPPPVLCDLRGRRARPAPP